jgi:hypothetical protein
MAAEGMKFTNFYTQAVCGPSRAALILTSSPILDPSGMIQLKTSITLGVTRGGTSAGGPTVVDTRNGLGWSPSPAIESAARPADRAHSGNGETLGGTPAPGKLDVRLRWRCNGNCAKPARKDCRRKKGSANGGVDGALHGVIHSSRERSPVLGFMPGGVSLETIANVIRYHPNNA